MFNKKTVVVVGAGASKEANLPTGHELKPKVAEILNIRFDGSSLVSGDYLVRQALEEVANRDEPNAGINPYLHAAWRIRAAMPQAPSIDNFIDTHQGNQRLELCGKLAVVRAILEAERHSFLYFDNRQSNSSLNFGALENTWLNAFMQLLTENCRADGLNDRLSSIALIVFNYDRCIEHFLYHSLQNYYGIDEREAARLVRGIEIYHPYGTVGSLPWYDQAHAVGFGEEPNPKELLDLVDCIKTFTEGTDPNASEIYAIKRRFVESHIVLFLGFAFHRLNIEILKPPQGTHSNSELVRYFGTAKGISTSDCEVIRSVLADVCDVAHEDIVLRNDRTCSELFQEYRRTLSLY